MADNYTTSGFDLNEERPALNPGLNVLTILTFIGSGIGILFSIASPVIMKFSKSMMDKAVSSGTELSSKEMAEIEKGRHAIAIAQANMVPSIISGLAGCILCIIAAVMMRKLKKDGYWIYVAGELLPVIVGLVLMGTQQFTGVMSYLFALVVPAVFIILYTVHRKYLIY